MGPRPSPRRKCPFSSAESPDVVQGERCVGQLALSSQKPEPCALERDEAPIEHWRKRTLSAPKESRAPKQPPKVHHSALQSQRRHPDGQTYRGPRRGGRRIGWNASRCRSTRRWRASSMR